MGVDKTPILKIYDYFPGYREKIRKFLTVYSNFQSLCEDFLQCREAMNYWSGSEKPEAPELRLEYMELTHELEFEIIQFLNKSE